MRLWNLLLIDLAEKCQIFLNHFLKDYSPKLVVQSLCDTLTSRITAVDGQPLTSHIIDLTILEPKKDPSDRLAETCSGRKPRTAIIDLKSHEFFQGTIS